MNRTCANLIIPTGSRSTARGNLYVADLYNNVIRKVTPAGVATTPYGSLTGRPEQPTEPGNNARFYYPRDLALDSINNLYVADEGNNSIRKINLSTGVVSTFAGPSTSSTTRGASPSIRPAMFTWRIPAIMSSGK